MFLFTFSNIFMGGAGAAEGRANVERKDDKGKGDTTRRCVGVRVPRFVDRFRRRDQPCTQRPSALANAVGRTMVTDPAVGPPLTPGKTILLYFLLYRELDDVLDRSDVYWPVADLPQIIAGQREE